MSNERTLPESQGAEGGGSGHEEAQLQARGRQIKGDRPVKGTGPPVTAPDQPLGAAWGWACWLGLTASALITMLPGLMGSAGAAAQASRTKAECDEEGTSWELQCWFLEVEMKQMTVTKNTNCLQRREWGTLWGYCSLLLSCEAWVWTWFLWLSDSPAAS